jgi:hypothetical protein
MSTPNGLTNSKRRHETRAYTPLVVADPEDDENSDALNLAARVRSLMMTDAERAAVRGTLQGRGEIAALEAMNRLTAAVSASGVLAAASSLIAVSRNDLRSVSDALAGIRTDAANNLIDSLRDLDRSYTARSSADVPSYSHVSENPQRETPKADPAALSRPAIAALKVAADAVPNQPRDVKLHVPPGLLTAPRATEFALASVTVPQKATAASANRLLQTAIGPALADRAHATLLWARSNRPEQYRPLLALAQRYAPSETDPDLRITGALTNLTRLKLLTQLFSQSLTERPLQPMGLLHLERLEMIPGSVERGELAYSLPLAPNEKVTLAHREWSVREEQFSEFIEDVLENYSEQGVAQTDDISLSTLTQSNHNNALSMSQPVASANGVHLTSSIDTTQSVSIDDTQSREESKSQSRTVTALASTRTMKDHKVSFTVTTVSGMEDFTAHLIENKHRDKSMRIDYFKRVRKWQSDLYRYGVRLTYDVVLPDPGARLRSREVELQKISAQLATEFNLWLVPSQISVFNWETLADQYGVALPAPPDQARHVEASQTVSFATPDDVVTGSDGVKYTSHHRVLTLNVTTPADYQLSNLNVFTSVQVWPVAGYGGWVNAYAGESVNLATADVNGYCNIDWNLGGTQVPPDGQVTVFFRMQVAQSGLLKLTATFVPTESSMERWRLTAWTIIRDAAAARAAQHRSYLRDRQAALQREIAGDDAVRLRRMEREAIMRCVLEWLFPGFQDASSVLANLPAPGELDAGRWQQVMQYGEYIKFVQTAIDWDNVMVFLYPYFWDTLWHEDEKLFFAHPDPVHREFLRAGAVRVILAIQPGFEEQVVSLLDQGQLGALSDQNRFSKALDYVKAANADYNATASAEESDRDRREPGVLIGSWTDYTPSSALDIQTIVMSLIEV